MLRTYRKKGFSLIILLASILTVTSLISGCKPKVKEAEYTGKIDGVEVKYSQEKERTYLTLYEKIETEMYDENDTGVLGDTNSNPPDEIGGDWVRFTYPNGVVVLYTKNYVYVVGSGEVDLKIPGKLEQTITQSLITATDETVDVTLEPTDKVFTDSTKRFQEFKGKILPLLEYSD